MFQQNRSNRWITTLFASAVLLTLGGLAAVADAHMDAASVAAHEPTVAAPVTDPPIDRTLARPVPAAIAPPAPASTTSTTAPPPAPAPPVTAAPAAPARSAPAARPAAPVSAPAPAAPAPAAAPTRSPQQSVQAAFESSVPAAWRNTIAVTLQIIPGTTSWGHSSGRIEIAESVVPRLDVLRVTIAHEFGHLIAYRYGSQAFTGAAPAGWPAYSNSPAEAWADCVSQVFTGIADPSHGLPACSGPSLSWTATWLGQGPGAHPRTR